MWEGMRKYWRNFCVENRHYSSASSSSSCCFCHVNHSIFFHVQKDWKEREYFHEPRELISGRSGDTKQILKKMKLWFLLTSVHVEAWSNKHFVENLSKLHVFESHVFARHGICHSFFAVTIKHESLSTYLFLCLF